MIPGIDTGGGGLSNSTSSADRTSSGNSGSTTSSDRISKQIFNISSGANAFDMNMFLANANNTFASIVKDTNREPFDHEPRKKTNNIPIYVGVGAATFVVLVGVLVWGKKN